MKREGRLCAETRRARYLSDVVFVFVPLTEPETDFPTRSTEPDNELTRARVMGRDNRDLGGKSALRGGGGRSAGVSRRGGREGGEKRLVASCCQEWR